MKMPWTREAVRILPTKIDLTRQSWCRDALLLHVRGIGALRWETRALPPEADYYESARCLTLHGTPLLSGHFAAWETSESGFAPAGAWTRRSARNWMPCAKPSTAALPGWRTLFPPCRPCWNFCRRASMCWLRATPIPQTAAEIGYPTDRELETWLTNPGLHRPQLRGALVVLRSRGDSRLKDTALRCAAVGDQHCSLKAEAFQVLAELKGDPDVEAFFIDYFVGLEEPPSVHGSAQDYLTELAHSFWS